MKIYAIFDVPHMAFVRWGINGGGEEGYCLHRGKPCFFRSLADARAVVDGFDNPEYYEIRGFKEME